MAHIQVRVKPKSARSRVLECREGVWQIALTSPPQDGKANRELVRLLAKSLHIAPSLIEVVSGEKSRNKTLAITGLSEEELEEELRRNVEGRLSEK